MSDSLGSNLKLLCSHYRSIAEVCRKLAINRAQFNRYLAGQSRPTAHNLKRICDFFGVEPFELAMPSEQFARLIGARSGDAPSHGASDPLLELFAPLRRQASPMDRYCGYYFEYSNCMSVPGHVLLSLVHLREERGNYLFERQERQERQEQTRGGSEDWVRCRYLGTAVYANSITLTPGTISTSVEAGRILVHALSSDGIDELEQGAMDRRVSGIEG